MLAHDCVRKWGPKGTQTKTLSPHLPQQFFPVTNCLWCPSQWDSTEEKAPRPPAAQMPAEPTSAICNGIQRGTSSLLALSVECYVNEFKLPPYFTILISWNLSLLILLLSAVRLLHFPVVQQLKDRWRGFVITAQVTEGTLHMILQLQRCGWKSWRRLSESKDCYSL